MAQDREAWNAGGGTMWMCPPSSPGVSQSFPGGVQKMFLPFPPPPPPPSASFSNFLFGPITGGFRNATRRGSLSLPFIEPRDLF